MNLSARPRSPGAWLAPFVARLYLRRPELAEGRFCGTCHAADIPDVPQVNLRDHGEPYVCWQCHYPHYPEAR